MLEARGVKYVPTEDDRLWLLRAVQAEGAPHVLVARALVNNFMLQRALRGLKMTLADFIRSYAQPVNPRWYPDGALFRAVPRTALELRQAELRRDGHSKRTTFDARVRNAVRMALEHPFPSDVTDYAVPSLDGTKKGYVARGEPVRGENRFWTRRPGWQGYFVGGASVATWLVVAVAVWAAWGRA